MCFFLIVSFFPPENLINNIKSDESNIIPIITPNINKKDVFEVALNHNISEINRLNEIYNTTSSIIVKISDINNTSATISVFKTDTKSEEELKLNFVNNSNIYNSISLAVLQILNDLYKKDIIDNKGYIGQLNAVFVINSIHDILKIEDILKNTKYINSFFLKAMSQNMIQINIKTKAHKKSIINLLIEKGFFIEDKVDYILVR